MKISDLLRDFADTHLLRSIADAVDDQLEQADGTPPEKENVDGPKGIFIPPLQQKIELMKKSTGVQNVYDDGQDEDDEGVNGGERHSYPDPMQQIRKNAGIQCSDDEPTDD